MLVWCLSRLTHYEQKEDILRKLQKEKRYVATHAIDCYEIKSSNFLYVEWSHSTQEIVQGFDNSMQSPEVPVAAQPQVLFWSNPNLCLINPALLVIFIILGPLISRILVPCIPLKDETLNILLCAHPLPYCCHGISFILRAHQECPFFLPTPRNPSQILI